MGAPPATPGSVPKAAAAGTASGCDRQQRTKAKEENIQVAVRMRPLGPQERRSSKSHVRVWKVDADEKAILETTPDGAHEPGHAAFAYAHTFGELASNLEVYDRIGKGIVSEVMQGYHGTIIAYGQTSSGKTFSMQGDGHPPSSATAAGLGKNRGIVHMAASDIFAHINQETYRDFSVRVSYIEIYNETVRDLLSPQGGALAVREDRQKRFFAKSREVDVTSVDGLLDFLFQGEERRSVGATRMNSRSSRSHTIFRIAVESRPKESEEDGDVVAAASSSTLNLVDLAGSESVRHTGATGERQKEGGKINKSLLALTNVITSLGENARLGGGDNRNAIHVNYRGSNLTKILQPSLSGNAKVAILCCATPSEVYLDETKMTLKFADRAQLVKTNAKKSRRRLADGVVSGGGQQTPAARPPLQKMSRKRLLARRLFGPPGVKQAMQSPPTGRGAGKAARTRVDVKSKAPKRGSSASSSSSSSQSPVPKGDDDNEAAADGRLGKALAGKDARIATLEAELRSARGDATRDDRSSRADDVPLRSSESRGSSRSGNDDDAGSLIRAEIASLRSESRTMRSGYDTGPSEERMWTGPFEGGSIVTAEGDRSLLAGSRSTRSDATEGCNISGEMRLGLTDSRSVLEELECSRARIGELEWEVGELRHQNELLRVNAQYTALRLQEKEMLTQLNWVTMLADARGESKGGY